MKQEIAYTMTGITAGAVKASQGLEDHEETLDIKYCTLVVLNAARALAFAAALLFNNAKTLLGTKRAALWSARDTARTFATLARDILKPIFGSEFNSNWISVGFVDSLAIPTDLEELMALMEKMAAFFAANLAREVAVLNITAAQALAHHATLEAAVKAVTGQESVVNGLMVDRDAKYNALRLLLVRLVDELSYVLDPVDSRWSAFGFNKPGARETPDVPEGVMVVLIGPNAAATKWGASARADYYRVWIKVRGVDTEPRTVGSPADLDFTIENLPAAAQVEIMISALNNGGESALSEPITITTH